MSKRGNEAIVREMLRAIGEDPNREGLRETPARVVKSWAKLFGGYKQEAKTYLRADFASEGYDELIMLGPIDFTSFCEHHMLPFFGTVTVAYIPGSDGRVVGVSKLARAVEVFARRLQIQERMTKQIADAIEEALKPLGVAVVVRAQHLCMVARGVEKHRAVMTTSAIRGEFRRNAAAREEFLRLMEGQR